MTATKLKVLLRKVRIVGNYYRDDEAKAVHGLLKRGDRLTLELEPTNEYDDHAVKVLAAGVHIGYIPADCSAIFYVCGVDAVQVEVNSVATPKAGKGVNVQIDVLLDTEKE